MLLKKFFNWIFKIFSEIAYKHKPLIRPFFVLFIFFVLVLNFNQIIWLFNKRAIDDAVAGMMESSQLISSLERNQYQTNTSNNSNGNNSTQEGEVKQVAEMAKNYIFENAFLEIPKIGIRAPISFPETGGEQEISKALIGHAMHFPGSAYPGEKGDVFFLSHSAPMNWSSDYRIFNNINQLESGDTVLVNFNNRTFRYKVLKNFIIKPGEGIAPSNNSSYSMHLMTCWPPGSSKNRMVVEAVME